MDCAVDVDDAAISGKAYCTPVGGPSYWHSPYLDVHYVADPESVIGWSTSDDDSATTGVDSN